MLICVSQIRICTMLTYRRPQLPLQQCQQQRRQRQVRVVWMALVGAVSPIRSS